jgi:hypothetical protein
MGRRSEAGPPIRRDSRIRGNLPHIPRNLVQKWLGHAQLTTTSAEFDTFHEALAWIDDRVRENPRRIPKLVAASRITAKMARDLTAKGVIFGRT